MKLRASGALLGMVVLAGLAAQGRGETAKEVASARERLSLDRGWLFHQGDIPFPVITGHAMTYANSKLGKAWGAAAPDYDDSGWRKVDLPHDWAVEGPFDKEGNNDQGYRDRGMGWYRRYFKLDASDRGKHLELQFDGIATHATIWVNGVLAERNWCGYTSAYIDITPFAKFGDAVNTIAVQVDAVAQEGWWYEGAGIYRHTWLVKQNSVHIETDGVYANPVRGGDGRWTIPVEVTLGNSDTAPAEVEVESTVMDPSGKAVATGSGKATVEPVHTAVAKFSVAVASPALWSVETPNVYHVNTVAKRNGVVVDEVTTPCGFRTLRFDAKLGFFLNDKPLKILGTCNHQDMAGIGVAVPDSIWDFRIRRLKEMGSNAYRCAHNPVASELLDVCDRTGMMVMEENRNFGSGPEQLKELQWMVRRDRNHPSIILWSLFNEEPLQTSEAGYQIARRMSAAVKDLDTTRPVTGAQSSGLLNPVNASLALDVAGINYRPGDYDPYHAMHPDKPVFSSEDTSTVMTRDEYKTDKKGASVLDSYDDQAPPWALSHRMTWKGIDTRPFMAGTMVWTGFDYRGEPQPLSWPTTGSSFGCMDLCGFPKAAYYIHQAEWLKEPMVRIVPHWNWAGSEGKPIKVMVLTNAERVALSLNGKVVKEQAVDKYEMMTVDVPYEAGKLEAVASNGGKEVTRFAVETTGAPAALKLVADRERLAGDGMDAEPVTVEAVDAEGRVVPTAGPEVTFELEGPGAIIGLNNGDPRCHEPEKGSVHSLFHGLGQVIVQSEYEGTGTLRLRAKAEGVASAEVGIEVKKAAAQAQVPVATRPEPTTRANGKKKAE